MHCNLVVLFSSLRTNLPVSITELFCYRCGDQGHMARDCDQTEDGVHCSCISSIWALVSWCEVVFAYNTIAEVITTLFQSHSVHYSIVTLRFNVINNWTIFCFEINNLFSFFFSVQRATTVTGVATFPGTARSPKRRGSSSATLAAKLAIWLVTVIMPTSRSATPAVGLATSRNFATRWNVTGECWLVVLSLKQPPPPYCFWAPRPV